MLNRYLNIIHFPKKKERLAVPSVLFLMRYLFPTAFRRLCSLFFASFLSMHHSRLLFLYGSRLFLLCSPYDLKNDQQQYDRNRQRNKCRLRNARNNISDHTDCNYNRSILHLCLHVIQMITLCAGGRHDRCIRNRRNMISTYTSGHDRCHTDYHR